MIARRLSEVAVAVRGELRGHDVEVRAVSTDSRTVSPGALFFALHGERFDGHAFVGEAISRGAVAAVVEGEPVERSVVVPDTTRALLDLAADERRRIDQVAVVGVTGANGKTTTKDMTAAVLGRRMRTHASPGSFNNEVGLPVTMLGAPEGTEAIVAEMGARREGDVALLCEVARPDVVVVTNVGVAHMEVFGSWEAIVEASAEPVDALGTDGIAILNADDPTVAGYAARSKARVLTFGTSPTADVRAEAIEVDGSGRTAFALVIGGERERVELDVPGEHMVPNALAAAACGHVFGVAPVEAAAAVKDARLSRWRMETFTTADGVVVVNDAYNANPESMLAGLRAARTMARDGRRLAAVLGHMAELGPIALEEHDRLGELVVRIGVDRLVTVGEAARTIARSAIREGQPPEDVATYDDAADAAADVRTWAREHDVVLVKGSRVAGLERVAEALR